MNKERGNSRHVFVFNDFVIKIAILRWPMFRTLWVITVGRLDYQEFKRHNNTLRDLFTPVYKSILVNWREFIFYQKTKNIFLAPTYFSFFGIINIQSKRKILRGSTPDIVELVDRNSNFEKLRDFGDFQHALLNSENYGWDHSGHLTIVDYGDKVIHNFIRSYGQALYYKFVERTQDKS